METLSLWDQSQCKPARSTQEGFDTFHAENPHIYRLFERFALEAARRRPRFAARMIGERIRWYSTVETEDTSGFKVNNNYWPFYARVFERDHPEHTGVFEKRKAIADGTAS